MRSYQGCIVDDSKDCAVGAFTVSLSEHDTSADGFLTTPLSKFRFRERHYEFGGDVGLPKAGALTGKKFPPPGKKFTTSCAAYGHSWRSAVAV
jgi:hypothetical protein